MHRVVVLGREWSLGQGMVWECWEGGEFRPGHGVVVLGWEGSLGHRMVW